MKRIYPILFIFAVLFGYACPSQAQTVYAYQNWCQIGGKTVMTSGLPSSNTVQQSFPNCTVTVYFTGTTTKATIYSDTNLTLLANPFTALTDASFKFFAAGNTAYDVTISGAGIPSPKTFANTCIACGVGSGGATLPSNAPVYGLSPTTSRAATYGDLVQTWNASGPCTGYLKNDGTCDSGTGGSTPFGFHEVNASNGAGSAFQGTNIFVNNSAQNRYSQYTDSTVNIDGNFTSIIQSCNHYNPLIGYNPANGLALDCMHMTGDAGLSGFDQGGTVPGRVPFSNTTLMYLVQGDHGRGLTGVLGVQLYKTGPDDGHAMDVDAACYNAPLGDSGEACQVIRGTVRGPGAVYFGTIDSVTSSTQFHVNCVFDCSNAGVGRYVHRVAGDVATGVYVASVDQGFDGGPSTVHLATSVNGVAQSGIASQYISTFEGQLLTTIDLQAKAEPPFTTSVTFTVQAISGTPVVSDPITGPFMFPSANYSDSIVVTNVTSLGGGQYSITGLASWPQVPGSANQARMYQGKAKMNIDLYLNRTDFFEETNIPHPFECDGATDAYTLKCGQYFAGQFRWDGMGEASVWAFPLTFQTVHNSGTTLIIDNEPNFLFRGLSAITLTGMTPSFFNGPCTGVTITNSQLRCTNSSLSGTNTATVNGLIHIGATDVGTAQGDIEAIAMVVDVRNPTTHQVNGTFMLEPNNIGFTVGDSVMEDQGQVGYYAGYHMNAIMTSTYTRNIASGMDLNAIGFGGFCGTQGTGYFCNSAIRISNSNSLGGSREHLQGFGGVNAAENAITLGGIFGTTIYQSNAPLSGQPFIFIGCPYINGLPNDCDNTDYLYDVFHLAAGNGDTTGGDGDLFFKPGTAELISSNFHWQFQRGRILVGGELPCLASGNDCWTSLTTGLKKWSAGPPGRWLDTTYADYVAKWSPCNSSNPYLRFDGTCDNGPGSAVTQLVAGTGVVLSPPGGTGVVTISASGTGGSVTNVSGVNANGFSFSIATPTTTPVITLNVDGSHYLPTTSDQANWNGKQAAGSYITSITGDGTASGPGAAALTVTRLNGTSLAGLTTGLLKNTTSTGVPSIAGFSDINGLILAQAGCGTTGNFFQPNTGTCVAPTGTGTVTHTGSLTANKLMIGNGTADSKVDPNAGTDGAGNATFVSVAWNDGTSVGGGQDWTEGTAPTGVASHDFIYADSTAHRLKMNNNNGTAAQIVGSGVDINTSDQVTATHLAAPLPVAQGGTGTASPGIVAGTNVTVTGTWPNQTVNASGGAPSNYATSAGFTRIGPGTSTPTQTLTVFDATPTIGSTNLTVTAGAGQSGDVCDIGNPNFICGQFGEATVEGTAVKLPNGVTHYLGATLVDTGIPTINYSSHLTAQTASLGTQTIAATPAAGDYRVCAHVMTTTAGSAGTALVTVTWSNGAAKSLLTTTINLATAFDEQKACYDYTSMTAAAALAYTTTVAGATGSPQYKVDVQAWRIN